jgi:hypothetical protein
MKTYEEAGPRTGRRRLTAAMALQHLVAQTTNITSAVMMTNSFR